ncbi:MAG: hypothetical protein KGD63_03020 [Candidatus Lokiarchaeota archaeon]|nr:hypothetical protein [Candidatus Lokiarchaeota archaeon]
MYEFKNCIKVAEIIGKHNSIIIRGVNLFKEGKKEELILKNSQRHPSRLSKIQKEALRQDFLTHPYELGYNFSNWNGKSLPYYIKHKFGIKGYCLWHNRMALNLSIQG